MIIKSKARKTYTNVASVLFKQRERKREESVKGREGAGKGGERERGRETGKGRQHPPETMVTSMT